jgi:hypothetical protein
MSKPHPCGGIIPNAAAGSETSISEHVEKIEGKAALDAYVRSQTCAPGVVKRIRELEDSLWRLADAISKSGDLVEHPELPHAVQDSSLVLKDRLEIDVTGPVRRQPALVKGSEGRHRTLDRKTKKAPERNQFPSQEP